MDRLGIEMRFAGVWGIEVEGVDEQAGRQAGGM